MSKIVIVGAGLAGLTAAEILLAKLGPGHQITMIAPNRRFLFYPALVPFMFGKFREDEIGFDLYEKLTSHGIRFIQGEVLAIDPSCKELKITGEDISGSIAYDYLIVAVGRRLATERSPGFFEYAHHLLGIAAASNFRNALDNFYEGNIIVGMCPGARLPIPVLETALGLSKEFEKQIDAGMVTINAVYPKSLREIFAEAPMYSGLEQELKKHGITLIENFPISEIAENQIRTADGRTLNSHLLMLIPPFRGQSMLRGLRDATDADGFARVDPHLQIEGLKDHYAAGDITNFPGPKFGYLAARQGEIAAENVVTEIQGERRYKVYVHELSPVYKPKTQDSIFFRYGIWDNDLFSPVEGTVLSWANSIREKYDEIGAA